MPADFSSAAAALALSPSLPAPGASPSLSDDDNMPEPPWARPRASSSRRLSRPYSTRSATAQQPLYMRILSTAASLGGKAVAYWQRLPLLHQLALAAFALVSSTLGILFLVYSHHIFAWLAPVAQGWRALPFGWALAWLFTFCTAFPPMIGYSTAVTVSGFVWGFPAGWPIVATASVAGSTAAFLTSRGVFSAYVHRLVGADRRFQALGHVLRRDGLLVLTGVRFCPLPYSLSNGFLATVPSVTPAQFALSTALASPKLLVHVFIGAQFAQLAESGDEMSAGARALNYASMALGGLVGLAVGLFVYRRTMARAAELAREEGLDAAAEEGRVGDGYLDGDEEGALLDPDEVALMGDDDISLWGAEEFEGGAGGAYRDEDGQERQGKKGGEANGAVRGGFVGDEELATTQGTASSNGRI